MRAMQRACKRSSLTFSSTRIPKNSFTNKVQSTTAVQRASQHSSLSFSSTYT